MKSSKPIIIGIYVLLLLMSVLVGTIKGKEDYVSSSNEDTDQLSLIGPITDSKCIAISIKEFDGNAVELCFEVKGKKKGEISYKLYNCNDECLIKQRYKVTQIQDKEFLSLPIKKTGKHSTTYQIVLEGKNIPRNTQVYLYSNNVKRKDIIMEVSGIKINRLPLIRLVNSKTKFPYLWDMCLIDVFITLIYFAFMKKYEEKKNGK